jgi:hypothetical protein
VYNYIRPISSWDIRLLCRPQLIDFELCHLGDLPMKIVHSWISGALASLLIAGCGGGGGGESTPTPPSTPVPQTTPLDGVQTAAVLSELNRYRNAFGADSVIVAKELTIAANRHYKAFRYTRKSILGKVSVA